jgi:hypothetical protein
MPIELPVLSSSCGVDGPPGTSAIDAAPGTSAATEAKRFKMILADPPAHDDDYDKAYPNLGILQLISYVRETDAAHRRRHHLPRSVPLVRRPLAMLIEEHQPRIYGMSFAFLTQRIAYETINVIKHASPTFDRDRGRPASDLGTLRGDRADRGRHRLHRRRRDDAGGYRQRTGPRRGGFRNDSRPARARARRTDQHTGKPRVY